MSSTLVKRHRWNWSFSSLLFRLLFWQSFLNGYPVSTGGGWPSQGLFLSHIPVNTHTCGLWNDVGNQDTFFFYLTFDDRGTGNEISKQIGDYRCLVDGRCFFFHSLFGFLLFSDGKLVERLGRTVKRWKGHSDRNSRMESASHVLLLIWILIYRWFYVQFLLNLIDGMRSRFVCANFVNEWRLTRLLELQYTEVVCSWFDQFTVNSCFAVSAEVQHKNSEITCESLWVGF